MSPTPRAKRPRADHRVGVPPAQPEALDVELGEDGAEAPLEEPITPADLEAAAGDPAYAAVTRLERRIVELEQALEAAGAVAPLDLEARVAVVDTGALRFVGQPGSRIAGRAGDALEALPSPDDGVDTPALGRGDLVILAVPYDTRERILEELARLLPALRRV